MLKKILFFLIIIHATLIALSAYINHQLQAYTWQEAGEQTQANQELQLEGRYKVFSPAFEKGRALYESIGKYNWIDPVLWDNGEKLNVLHTFQLQDQATFEQQYNRQKIELVGAYKEAEYAYIDSQMKNNTPATGTYDATKTFFKQQFEKEGAQGVQKRQEKLEKEMKAFKAQFSPTLDALTGEENSN